ncbi:hypothetical protein A3J91_03145 [Candidatus Peribacteria bacterium RIFOXYC2_FULL_58_10]|nr:MAG: hypothetical protein A3J91_03145 [Candidatus Peribacteria bacterium RIFOXYC2_FULL_58_10]OGJ84655.1 MAG: hypothetical protein A2529_03800 [Candidatus Peribacteria bacterium RIFOXYD2_FULL_58_15]
MGTKQFSGDLLQRISEVLGDVGNSDLSLRAEMHPIVEDLRVPDIVLRAFLLPSNVTLLMERSSALQAVVGEDAVALKIEVLRQGSDVFALRLLKAVEHSQDTLTDLVTLILLEGIVSLRSHLPDEEVSVLWISLADRLGLWKMRYLLEDCLFEARHPQDYQLVSSLLERQGRIHERLFADISAILAHRLEAGGLRDFRLSCRHKNVSGVYQKMQRKGQTLNHITDLFGFRIITRTARDCYRALEILHRTWRPFPERFKDYILAPKANGYRSIHSTICCLEGQTVEFQIRTEEMDAAATFGHADHASYKQVMRLRNESPPFPCNARQEMCVALPPGASCHSMENTVRIP